eukprot:4006959-Pleurochrysis_carterae.AAC.2
MEPSVAVDSTSLSTQVRDVHLLGSAVDEGEQPADAHGAARRKRGRAPQFESDLLCRHCLRGFRGNSERSPEF